MKLDELIKEAPEVYTIKQGYRLSRIREFSFDDSIPPLGCLIMWEPPRKGFIYTIGVDPSWGLPGGDRSAIHILRNGTVRSLDTQVGEFVSDDINVHDLSPICYMMGKLYEDPVDQREALMSVECNISDSIVYDLRTKFNYGNLFIWKYYDNITNVLSRKLGWYTTARTRPKLINKVMQYVKHDWWDVSSPWLISEMETIEKLDDKAQIQAALGLHDDIFMAGSIALWSAHDLEFTAGTFDDEMASKRTRELYDRREAEHMPIKPVGERRDYQNTECTYEDMMKDKG